MPESIGRDTPDEQALVASARAGDHEAFGQLVLRHERAAVRTALAALGRLPDAEDAAQDAFLLAWRKLRSFRGDASFRTWLLTIVWRKAIARRRADRWRRPGRRAGRDEHGDEALLNRLESRTADPEQRALARNLARRIARSIKALSPKLRDTLLLAASGEHTYDEMAALLGVPTGTVKWRVSEARRQVAAVLEDAHET